MEEEDVYEQDGRRSCSSTTPSVKIAGLWKRSQGLRKFTKPNWRHRVFILTDQTLSYYSGTLDRIGTIKGRVMIDAIKAIEYVDHVALGLAHTLQIIYLTKKHGYVTLYITGRDKEECDDWVVCLRQACYFNQDMLMHYHPGAFTRNGWSCCNKRSRPTLGCQPTYYLLTRSSSRYAETRRMQRANRRSQSRPYSTCSTPNRPSATSDIVYTTPTRVAESGRSNSCDNLRTVGRGFPLVNFSDTPTHASLDVVSGLDEEDEDAGKGVEHHHMLVADSHVTATPPRSMRKSVTTVDNRHTSAKPSDRKLSYQEGTKSRHQVAPLTPLAVSHKHQRLLSVDSGVEATPPPSTKKMLYVGGSQSSSISVDCDYHCYSWPRKVSIQPRISDTDPEVIHV